MFQSHIGNIASKDALKNITKHRFYFKNNNMQSKLLYISAQLELLVHEFDFFENSIIEMFYASYLTQKKPNHKGISLFLAQLKILR